MRKKRQREIQIAEQKGKESAFLEMENIIDGYCTDTEDMLIKYLRFLANCGKRIAIDKRRNIENGR